MNKQNSSKLAPASARSLRIALVASALIACAAVADAADGPVENVSVKAIAHFGFDGTSIAPAEQAKILEQVGAMKDVTWQTVRTTGYTDSVGTTQYNEALAARRADKVKSYLVGKGLDAGMIKTQAKGPSDPIADNSTAEGRAMNRRAEVEFLGVRSASR
jgi:OOP family OmpA-OmpF porin